MRLGIGSYAFAWSVGVPGSAPPRPMTVLDLIDTAAELGVGVVQICDNLPLDVLPETQVAELRRHADRCGVRIEVGTRGIRPEQLDAYLRLAVRLQSPILRVVVDTADHRPSLDDVVTILRPQVSALQQAGIVLAIENHDRFSARQFAEICQRLASPWVGICLDTVNSFAALEGPEVVMATLAPWVVNLHVKDFTIRRVDHQMGFVVEGRPAGQGRLSVPWLLEQLRAAGRDPNAILEQWPPPEATIEETMAKERQWAQQSIVYLRGLISQ